MSKVPSSCEIQWLAIKQHNLTMIYINLFARAIVTAPTPWGTRGERLNRVCVSHCRKMRARRELEPKGPKPVSPYAQGPNSSSSQHPASVTFSPPDVHVETRWPPPWCCLSHCLKSLLRSRPTSAFLLWQLQYEFLPVRSTGASHPIPEASGNAQPHSALPSPPPLCPYLCCHLTKKLWNTLLSSEEVELWRESNDVGLALSPPKW